MREGFTSDVPKTESMCLLTPLVLKEGGRLLCKDVEHEPLKIQKEKKAPKTRMRGLGHR